MLAATILPLMKRESKVIHTNHVTGNITGMLMEAIVSRAVCMMATI